MQNFFSYPLKLEDMSTSSQKYKLKATSEDLEYIAEIMKVPSIKKFFATSEETNFISKYLLYSP